MKPEWAARMRLAGRLGVSPQEFWALSVAEWRALTGAGSAGSAGSADTQAMDRTTFDALCKQFPDRRDG